MGMILGKGMENVKWYRGNFGRVFGWAGFLENEVPRVHKALRDGQPLIPLFDFLSGEKALEKSGIT
jgi:hypothetical protein